MTYEEFEQSLDKLDGDAYILKLSEPMEDEEQYNLRKAWNNLNQRIRNAGGTIKSLLLIPDKMCITDARRTDFDFSTALKLMDMGYHVERDTWTQGYIYKEKGIILQSYDGKEWTPTQGALRAINWRMV